VGAVDARSTAETGYERPAREPETRPIRVLYSFPHKIGAGRICSTAWYQVTGVAEAGAAVDLHPGAVARTLPDGVAVSPTLARGRVRVPYRVLGQQRALELHDRIVARRLRKLAGAVDVVHAWPSGALETLRTARELGVPTVLERPNAHTARAFAIVRAEEERLGVSLPRGHEHSFDERALRREEAEYSLADRLLCPSPFVETTFLEEGFPGEKLACHAYGFDETVFFPDAGPRDPARPFTAIFVGDNALRKGLHHALEAWRRSSASARGRFLVAGSLLPGYATRIRELLDQPGVEVLGRRSDVPELYRMSDVLCLPTLEEGSPLACLEAIGSGCVPVVSEVCAGVCRHGENALLHAPGDVEALAADLTRLDRDRELLAELREGALRAAPSLTWSAAGRRLLAVYGETVDPLGTA